MDLVRRSGALVQSTGDQRFYAPTVTELVQRNRDWDNFVCATGGCDIVQTSIWGLTKYAIGQPAVLVELLNRDRAIVGGGLMIERRLAAGARIGYVPRGPVAKKGLAPSVVLAAIVGAASQRGLQGLIIQPPEGWAGYEQAIIEAGFAPSPLAVAPEATVRIDVTRDDDSLLGEMTSGRRRNLRKSWNEPIVIEHSDDVAAFHALHEATSLRQGFSALSREYLEAQWRFLAPAGALSIVLARHRGKPVAALWLSRFGDTVTFRLAGWDAALTKGLHVNEALHWAAIQWARETGARTYDFGGFDRDAAERILSEQPRPADFEKTHNFFKLGFCQTPVLLPKAYFRLGNRVANRLARSIAPAVMHTSFARRFVQQLRNG